MSIQTSPDRVSLGATGIKISPMGIGTWAWVDTWFWQYGKGGYSDAEKYTPQNPPPGLRLADAEVAALDAASARVGK